MSEGRTASVPKGQEQEIDRYRIAREPFYAEVRGEVGLFPIAAQSRMPGARSLPWPAMKISRLPISSAGIC